jgi:hypothetical protein
MIGKLDIAPSGETTCTIEPVLPQEQVDSLAQAIRSILQDVETYQREEK